MDKKNTMLLTVIAVATLLVAVVGATFAYFSVTGTDSSNTSVITATTENVGTVALSSPVTTMTLATEAGDFRNVGNAVNYWAKADTGNAPYYETSEIYHNVLQLTSSGGASTAEYKCTVVVDIDTTITNATLASNEYTLYIKDSDGTSTATFDMATSSYTDLTKTFTIYLHGNETTYIQAAARLVNTTSPQEDHLNNSSIVTNIEAKSFSCDTVAASAVTTNSVA